jgi:thiosulfate/3-mercaptopyruvate sulfurtransferase
MNMKPVISPGELLQILNSKDLVIIDARAGSDAREKYQQQHLDKALFVDLETDLAEKTANPANGGRHPLPSPVRFASVLGKLGIQPGSHVVVYDDKNGANAASRFWWMLRAAGHESVQVLDGGLQAALKEGYPSSSSPETAQAAPPYEFSEWQFPIATISEVEKAVKDSAKLVIDVRDAYRYRGEQEPIDKIAGHIPGAKNIPFSENLDSQGKFLSPGLLKEKYTNALQGKSPEQLIVHCGSGVTACHTILSIAHAGLPVPALYVGSWSEWSRSDRPIATGE